MDMLMFQLDKNAAEPLYEQLYLAIKNSIIQRELKIATKLPSKRKLAEFLDISQTTIELAYGQLLAEGYVLSKPRVGYFVEDIDTLAYVHKEPSQNVPNAIKQTYHIDFNPGLIDTDAFPFTTWRKYTKDSIDRELQELLLVGDAQGEYHLRQEIANYLYQSRGVRCEPEQIVIGSGTEQLLPMVVQLLGKHENYGIENPGYTMTHHILKQNEQRISPITVDEDGMNINDLENSAASIAYVTPSHQFPTGAILSAARRVQLLNWASKKPARYIIEDDYDSEFRYAGKPLAALQGMDHNDKVIYMSTFSKSLMPSLRIAYFVLPQKLLAAYKEQYRFYSCTVPRIEQYALAYFMQDGHFSKHLNRMRKIYRRKLEKIQATLQYYSPHITVSGEQAGMHIMIAIRHEKNAEQLSLLAQENHIKITPIRQYLLQPSALYEQHLLLGFGGIPEQDIESNLQQLMAIWAIPAQQ